MAQSTRVTTIVLTEAEIKQALRRWVNENNYSVSIDINEQDVRLEDENGYLIDVQASITITENI